MCSADKHSVSVVKKTQKTPQKNPSSRWDKHPPLFILKINTFFNLIFSSLKEARRA